MPPSPWPVRTTRILTLVAVLAAVVLAVAWYGCSGETVWRIQVRWFGLGLLACALNAAGCLVWLATGIRALRRERAWTTAELRRREDHPQPVTAAAPLPRTELVTAARMRRYHRADCPLMRGKTAVPVTPDLVPCGVCES